MGVLSGNPKDEPMHYGEIYGVWQFSSSSKLGMSYLQAWLYHAGDKDLKGIIKDKMEQMKQMIQECDEILTANGIAPAPGLPERPEVKLEDIPPGARFTDPEIAAAIAADTSAGMTLCSQMAGMCIREDIAAMFLKFHTSKTTLAGRILRMNKEKGWLIPPPLQIKRPELVEA